MTELQKEKIKEIDNIASVSFNQEQKAIAKKIIENTPDSDLHEVFNFITQRVKLGFVFDEAPEVNHNAISFVRENENLNINITNLENLAGNIEHKLIIGENYDALKNLLVTHYEKIDVIYIDPPYNTEAMKGDGNDYKDEISANKFIYRDKFTRNGWLNMMNERLKLARKLLKDTGVIFISIDDSEQAYLKVLCDEIFGEGNFVANLCIKSAPAGTQSSKFFAQQHSYCLIYAKNISQNCLSKIKLNEGDLKTKYNQKDKYGEFYIERLWKRGIGGKKEDVPSLHFPIYYDEKNDLIYIDEYARKDKNLIKILPYQSVGVLGRWTWSKEKMQNEKHRLIVKKVNGEFKLHKKQYKQDDLGKLPNSIIDSDIARTELGSLELKEIMGAKVFDYPKPTNLIKHLLKISANKDSIILDFFAGSGTTAQAVMELNAEDGGKRECILVTNNENNIAINVTRERLYRIINGKGSNGEAIKWQYSKDKKCLEDNSVRVFEIETHELSLNDLEKAQDLTNIAKGELQKLNPEYDINDELKIYSELASLNPQKDK